MTSGDRPDVAFYCVSSSVYFLGAVAMLNSLRLVGHAEPIFLVDCGLKPAQRELLEPHVTVVPAPTDAPPYLLKTIAPRRHPAEVMVLIDADMIVTRPLTDLIVEASRGRVVAFENDSDRFVPEWGELLGLGPVRRRPYLSSGLVALGGELGAEVIRLQHRSQARANFDLSIDIRRRDAPDHPFLYLDQDVLNAILASRVKPEQLIAREHRLAPTPPYPRLRLKDEETLRCSYSDGAEPYVLHQYVRKPWLEPMYHGVYPRLFTRLLRGQDVAIKVPERDIPRRLRAGFVARFERGLVDVGDLGRWYLVERPSRWIAGRKLGLRHGRMGGRR